jgi:hypothetical protein
MNDDKTHLVVTNSMAQVNINNNLVMSRRVNANASPDVPKPLYQWGGYASPLIQSFGCTDSARALRRPTAHAPFGDTILLGYVNGAFKLASLAVRAPFRLGLRSTLIRT